MRSIGCIIIEDEPIAAGILQDYIAQVPYMKVLGCYESAIEAIPAFDSANVDVLFLDIHLPVVKGLDFLKSIGRPNHVIVTTAYHQYAVDGFELNVTDYLLKPYSFDRFLKAVARIDTAVTDQLAVEPNAHQNYIFVTSGKRQVKIDLSEIRYVEAQKEYVVIHINDAMIKSKMRLSVLEKMLPNPQFLRTHRSFIVSVNHLVSYDQSFIEIPGQFIPIGKSYRDHFLTKMGSFSKLH